MDRSSEIAIATRLPVAEVELIDRVAQERGQASRSSVLRDLIRRGIRDLERREAEVDR